jgi:trans-aconitate methyltransferase
VDYDDEKVAIAKHSFLSKKCNVSFKCADMREIDIPLSDAIIFNDSLHYIDAEAQKQVLKKAVASLNKGGMVIVQDGDYSQVEKHEKVKNTEVWSTQIIKFNRTSVELTFVSKQWMIEFAQQNELSIKICSSDNDSSETLYILTRLN